MVNDEIKKRRTFSLDIKTNEKNISNYISFITIQEYEKIKDNADFFLHKNEINYYNTLKTEKRKQSYLLGRYASKQALSSYCNKDDKKEMEIIHGAFNQPIIRYDIPNTPQISISHVNDIATAIVYEPGYNIGIDIEKVNPERYAIEQIAVSKSELKFNDELNLEVSQISTILWTQKEALSKAIQTGFLASLEILTISSLEKKDENIYKSQFEFFDNFVGYTGIFKDYVLSIVVPKKIHFEFDKKSLNDFFHFN